jgi:hypothetical protein
MEERGRLSLNFELLHIQDGKMEERNQNGGEEPVFSLEGVSKSFSMRSKAFSHSYLLPLAYFYFSFVIFFLSLRFLTDSLPHPFCSVMCSLLRSGMSKSFCATSHRARHYTSMPPPPIFLTYGLKP